ncbi:ATP-binding protein [Clostridium peptidivorans]|uniref:ATP-binding protein n=1 Tax=Clostridium peptidivorans TaxID=100174 RepID=UPI000BE3342F|nr:ATP-binding protein [Clostridium peptidivorans]
MKNWKTLYSDDNEQSDKEYENLHDANSNLYDNKNNSLYGASYDGLYNEEKVCPKCRGVGFIVKRDEKYQDIITPCSCSLKDNVKSKWKRAGLNVDNSKLNFKNYKVFNQLTRYCRNKALAYVKSFKEIRNRRQNSIAFLGQVGSGKTHLSIAIAMNLMELGVRAYYMPYRDVITKIKQNMLDDEAYKKSMGKYKTSELLIIDDLFKGKVTESDINIVFEIINHRYLNNYPMVISSEYTMEKLLDLDEAVGSRIFEMCRGNVVEIEGKENNYRLKER